MLSNKQIELLSFVDKNLEQGQTKSTIFKNYAQLNNLSYLSVRNAYYNILRKIKSSHSSNALSFFLNSQKNISNKTMQGEAKLLTMPTQNNLLSDHDITNLFMGLVRLVKRNTEEKIKSSFKLELTKVNQTYRKTLADFYSQKKDFDVLKTQNKKMAKQVVELDRENQKLSQTNNELNQKNFHLTRQNELLDSQITQIQTELNIDSQDYKQKYIALQNLFKKFLNSTKTD